MITCEKFPTMMFTRLFLSLSLFSQIVQVVIHTGEHVDDVITVRTGIGETPNRYIQCPDKYLREVDSDL